MLAKERERLGVYVSLYLIRDRERKLERKCVVAIRWVCAFESDLCVLVVCENVYRYVDVYERHGESSTLQELERELEIELERERESVRVSE